MAVLITGGGAGIGRAIAYELGRHGAAVVIWDKNSQHMNETCAAMSKEGLDVFGSLCDVSDLDQVSRSLDEVSFHYNRIDALVNSAGISRANPIAENAGHEVWRAVLATNLDGVYYCSHKVLPHMPDGGRIVNISSALGRIGQAGATAYCASKHGIVGFTRALAMEVAHRGITVNVVCPGWVDTDMARVDIEVGARRKGMTPDEFWRAEAARVPLGRLIQPKEVAELVCFLLSPAAKNITGQAIGICGGMVMR
jgi:ketoreductase